MTYCFSKEIYTKTALIKAAYSFTDDYYVHISTDAATYSVELIAKDEHKNADYNEFKNRILAQEVHELISNQTNDIRKLIMARAFASSVVDNESDKMIDDNTEYDASAILKDWFETHE